MSLQVVSFLMLFSFRICRSSTCLSIWPSNCPSSQTSYCWSIARLILAFSMQYHFKQTLIKTAIFLLWIVYRCCILSRSNRRSYDILKWLGYQLCLVNAVSLCVCSSHLSSKYEANHIIFDTKIYFKTSWNLFPNQQPKTPTENDLIQILYIQKINSKQ